MRAPYSLGSSGLLTELLVHVAADEGDVSVLELQSAGLDQAETAALLEAGLQSESEQRNGVHSGRTYGSLALHRARGELGRSGLIGGRLRSDSARGRGAELPS